MSYISRHCLNCDKEFQAEKREVNRGNGKFCGRLCSQQHAGKNRRSLVKFQPLNATCAHCSKEFYLNDSKKKNSKSGLYFCSRSHKDAAQCIGGIKAIMPPHYGVANGAWSYRNTALNHFGTKCNRCNYNENVAGIIVHHKDRNRQHNDLSNLEVLCGTCHLIEHYGEN